MEEFPSIRHIGVIVGPHAAEIRTEPLEAMGPEDLLLQMEICNICSTDFELWDGQRSHTGFPMAGGHEWSAIVVDKGECADRFEIGDRVSSIAKGCGVCPMCKRGKTSCCPNPLNFVNINGYYGDRGFSDYKVVHQDDVIRMSKDISAQEACFLEPVASVISGIKKLRLCAGENLVIIGAGTTGMLCAQVARAFGARVILSDLYQKKIERAQAMGNFEVIDGKSGDPVALIRDMTNGLGADAIIPSVGVTTVYRQALEMLKHFDGRMLIYAAGYPKPSLPIDPNEIHYHRREIIGSSQADREDFFDAAFMISNGIIDCKPCLEGVTFPLKDIQKALWALNKPSMYRISLDCQGI